MNGLCIVFPAEYYGGMGVMRMIVTFCGHSKLYQTGDFSKWLDIILPSLIEGGAATFYLDRKSVV